MASDSTFVQFVCEQARGAGSVSCRKMFGEYAIYVEGKVVAFVCDDHLFLKPTGAGRALLVNPVEAPAYPGSKLYFVIDDHIDDPEFLSALFRATEQEVPAPKPKKRGGASR